MRVSVNVIFIVGAVNSKLNIYVNWIELQLVAWVYLLVFYAASQNLEAPACAPGQY